MNIVGKGRAGQGWAGREGTGSAGVMLRGVGIMIANHDCTPNEDVLHPHNIYAGERGEGRPPS